MARPKNPALEKQRKDDLIATVLQMLTAGSSTSLSLDRVAKKAGVSKGMLTYYFRSKDELIIESIRRYHRDQQAMLSQIMELPMPANTKLNLLIQAAFPSKERILEELKFQVEVWTYAKQFPEVMEAVSHSYRSFRQACEAMLQRGIEDGGVFVSETEWTYRMIHALVDGLTFQVAADPDLNIDELVPRLMQMVELLLGMNAQQKGAL